MCDVDELDAVGIPTICNDGLVAYRKAVIEGTILATEALPACLQALGLLVPVSDSSELLVAVPPDVAAAVASGPIEENIAAQQWELSLLRGAIGSATDAYRSHVREAEVPVRLIRGQHVTANLIRDAAAACSEELIVALPGGAGQMDSLADLAPLYSEVGSRGIRRRTLHQHTARTHSPTMEFIKENSALGAEFRTVGEAFNHLVVIDRSVAFIPDQRYTSTGTALMVEHPGLVHYLASGFDDVWARADRIDPLHSRRQSATTTLRRSILRLLVDGHTDQVIAKRLGLSPRTVANHIKAVADEFGSRSRAQLGYQLATSEDLAALTIEGSGQLPALHGSAVGNTKR